MANTSSDFDEQRSISDIHTQLNKLFDAHSCSICHDVLNAPVSLPCQHLFCSECVRRHLLSHSVCPHPHCWQTATATTLTPQRSLDDVLAPVRAAFSTLVSSAMRAQLQQRHAQKLKQDSASSRYLVCLSHRDPGAKPKLIEKLRQNDLPVSGNVRILAARYREFVLKWNANLDANVPQSKQAIAQLVMKEERVRDFNHNGASAFAAFSASGHSNGSNPTSFFKKVCVDQAHPDSSKQANRSGADANTDEDLGEDADDVAEEGDDFDTLIRKTRLRDLKRKRAVMREREYLEKSRVQDSLLSPQSKRLRDSNSNSAPMREYDNSNQPAFLTVVPNVCAVNVCPTLSPRPFFFKGSTRPLSSPPGCVNKLNVADPRRLRVTASNFPPGRTAPQWTAASNTTFSQQSVHIAHLSLPSSTAIDTRKSVNSDTPVITDEIRQRIAEKRRIALDRKRRYNERIQMREMESRQQQQQHSPGLYNEASQVYPSSNSTRLKNAHH